MPTVGGGNNNARRRANGGGSACASATARGRRSVNSGRRADGVSCRALTPASSCDPAAHTYRVAFAAPCFSRSLAPDKRGNSTARFSNSSESPSSSGRPSLNDIHIVNLSLVSNVQVTREVSPTTSEPPQSLNLQRLNTRVRNQIDEKRRLVMALQAGVSPEGQKLFIAISKTIQDITWNGANIVVFNNVTIRPPYKVDNVHGNVESGAYRHVKKVVEKHIKDTLQAQQQRDQQQQTQKGGELQ